jgi:PAS domain S-box-containing protein
MQGLGLDTESLLRDVQDKFGLAFTYAASGMLINTLDGDILVANAAFCHLVDYTEDQLRGMSAFHVLLHPDDQAKIGPWLDQARAGRDVFDVQSRCQTRSGEWLHVRLFARAIRNDEGDILYFFTQVVDITDLVTAHEEVQRANEFKSRFLATTTHDLRSPLTTIMGFTHVLRGREFSREDQERYLDMIINEAERIDHMTEELSLVSQLEADALKSSPERINLGVYIHNLYPESLTADHQLFTLQVEPNLYVYIDPHHLQRVLENYFGNAHKYGRGPYTLRAYRDKDTIHIQIRDHGAGVAAKSIPELFLPFRQADGHQHLGTGLGLAIVKGFAQQAGGDAYYQRDGDESVFAIRLPAA